MQSMIMNQTQPVLLSQPRLRGKCTLSAQIALRSFGANSYILDGNIWNMVLGIDAKYETLSIYDNWYHSQTHLNPWFTFTCILIFMLPLIIIKHSCFWFLMNKLLTYYNHSASQPLCHTASIVRPKIKYCGK